MLQARRGRRRRRPVRSATGRRAAGGARVAVVDVHPRSDERPQAGRGQAKIPLGGAGHPRRHSGRAHLPAHVLLVAPAVPRRNSAQFKSTDLRLEYGMRIAFDQRNKNRIDKCQLIRCS